MEKRRSELKELIDQTKQDIKGTVNIIKEELSDRLTIHFPNTELLVNDELDRITRGCTCLEALSIILKSCERTSRLIKQQKWDEISSNLPDLPLHLEESNFSDLIQFVKGKRAETCKFIISSLMNRFNAALVGINWPIVKEFDYECQRYFNLLTELSESDAYECLSRYCKLEFRFHFSGSKPTNRIELSLLFILQCTQENVEFLSILDGGVSKFIKSLLLLIKTKIKRDMPRIIDNEALFSHYLVELLSFDQTILSLYQYHEGAASTTILDNSVLNDVWLDFEYLESSFLAELFDLPDFLTPVGVSTTSSNEVKTYLNAQSLKYKYLPAKYYRQLFDKVHVPLFDAYLGRLDRVILYFETNFYTVTDLVTKETDLGLVCQAINSLVQIIAWIDSTSLEDQFILLSSAFQVDDIFSDVLKRYQVVRDRGIRVVMVESYYKMKKDVILKHSWIQDPNSYTFLHFLSLVRSISSTLKVLENKSQYRVLHLMSDIFEKDLFEQVLLHHSFSKQEGEQLYQNFEVICLVLGWDTAWFAKMRDVFYIWSLPLDSIDEGVISRRRVADKIGLQWIISEQDLKSLLVLSEHNV